MTNEPQPLNTPSRELQDLAAAVTAYLVHRKAHEERVWTLRASVAVFFLSLTLGTALTNWVSHFHRVDAKPTRIDAISCGGTKI